MDKYIKVKPLGKGSFGAALLIKRKSDGELLVVKEVNMAKMNAKEREEARNECRILQQLSHPNIVRYYEHMEAKGVLYIIMEYADGGDLHSKMKRHPAGLPEDVSLHYFAQICLAMDYLHSRHILHRDIKTMNVFLTSSGAVKLGDFGIATVLRNTMGLANTVCGTPYYFSPELCKNKPYNNRSDVWAMGVVLYELATGKHAFDGSSMQQLMQRILKTNAPALPTTFSRDFRAMLDNCLQKDPLRRPNIKQLLTIEPVRSALQKLEQALMLATQCKVRLKDIVSSGSDSGNQATPRSSPSPPATAQTLAAPSNGNPNNLAAIANKTPQQFLADALAAPSPQIKPVIALHHNNNAPARRPSVSPSRVPEPQPQPQQQQQQREKSPQPLPPLSKPSVSPPLSPKLAGLGHVNAFIHELDRPLEEHAREAIRAFMKRKEEEAAEARRREAQALKELEEKKAEMMKIMAEHQHKMREAAKARLTKAMEQQQQHQLAEQQQIQRMREQSAQRAAALQQQQQQQQLAAQHVDPRPMRRPPQVLGEVQYPPQVLYAQQQQQQVLGVVQQQQQVLGVVQAGHDVTPRRNKTKKAIAPNSPRHPAVAQLPFPVARQPPPPASAARGDDNGRGAQPRNRSESPHPTPPVDAVKASNWIEKQANEKRRKSHENNVALERQAFQLLGERNDLKQIYQDDHSKEVPTRVVDPELDAWVRRQQNARRSSRSEPVVASNSHPPSPPLGAAYPTAARVVDRRDEVPAGVDARRQHKAQSESGQASPAALKLAPPVVALPAFHGGAFQEHVDAPRRELQAPHRPQQQPATARSYDHSTAGADVAPDGRSLTPQPSRSTGATGAHDPSLLRDVDRGGMPRMSSMTARDRQMHELDQSPPTGLATHHYRPTLPGIAAAGRRLPLELADENAAFGRPTAFIGGVEVLEADGVNGLVPEEDLVDPAEAEAKELEVKATYEDMLAHLKHVLDAKGRKVNGHSSRHLAAIHNISTPQAKENSPEEYCSTPEALGTPTPAGTPSMPLFATPVAATPQGVPSAPVEVLQSRRMLANHVAPLAQDIINTEENIGDGNEDGDDGTSSVDDFADEVPITPFRNAKKKQKPLPVNDNDVPRGDGSGSDGSDYFEDDDGAADGNDDDAEAAGDATPQQQPDEEMQFAHYLAQFCGDHFAGTVPMRLDGNPLFSTATAGAALPKLGGVVARPRSITARLREYIVSKIGRTATERSIVSLLSLKTADPSSPGSPGGGDPAETAVSHIKHLIVTSLHHRSGQRKTTTSDGLAELRRDADEMFCFCAQLLFLEEEGV